MSVPDRAEPTGDGLWLWKGQRFTTTALSGVIAGVLGGGRAVILPSDTSYALCLSPRVEGWLDRLCQIKSRPRDQPVSLFFADPGQATEYAFAERDEMMLLTSLLPGRRTVILKPGKGLRALPGGWPFDGVGVRIIDSPLVRAVCEAIGPVTATSANAHGEPPALSLDDLIAANPPTAPIGMMVDGGALPGGHSEVVDIRGGRENVIRNGALP